MSRSHLEVKGQIFHFLSLLLPSWRHFNRYFIQTSHKCSLPRVVIAHHCHLPLASMSRSHLEVKGQIFHFRSLFLPSWRHFNRYFIQTYHKCSPSQLPALGLGLPIVCLSAKFLAFLKKGKHLQKFFLLSSKRKAVTSIKLVWLRKSYNTYFFYWQALRIVEHCPSDIIC